MFEKPGIVQLRQAAQQLGMNPSDDYLRAVEEIVGPLSRAYAALDAMPDELPAVKYPRGQAYRPQGDENRYGAWYVKTAIKGAPSGKLAGRRVALKDNVCLAGVPMMIGADILEGYVPDVDATIVERILDAGGEIAGKAVCEYYCVSGGSHTQLDRAGAESAQAGLHHRRLVVGQRRAGRGGRRGYGDWRRPGRLDPHSGELLRHRRIEADLRSGALYRHRAARNDTRCVRADDRQCARQRAAARSHRRAGRHRFAPARRRRRRITPRRSTAASKACASACSRKALATIIPSRMSMRACATQRERFAKLGAMVEEVSVPTHAQGFPVWAAIRGDAACVTLLEMNGAGINHEGLYVLSLMDKAMAWRSRADDFADTIKIASIFSKYTVHRYGGRYYGKAQNIRRRLRAAYDAALAAHDLLLLPTTPMKATPIPKKARRRRRSRGAAGRRPAIPVRSTSPAIPPSACRAAWRTTDPSA